ncbi:hypothetical protein BJ742DRAFT_786445 [Cladochytrium replicatum]|nr:hypothetical protein BJ742DRAFT_786445 [Cladochytrium replicatum]
MMMIILIRDFLPLLQSGVDRPFVCYSNTFVWRCQKDGGNSAQFSIAEIMGSSIKILQYCMGAFDTNGYKVSHKVLLNRTDGPATLAETAATLMKAAASRNLRAFGLQSNLVVLKWLVFVPWLGLAMGRKTATITKEAQVESRRFLGGLESR